MAWTPPTSFIPSVRIEDTESGRGEGRWQAGAGFIPSVRIEDTESCIAYSQKAATRSFIPSVRIEDTERRCCCSGVRSSGVSSPRSALRTLKEDYAGAS